MSLSMESQSGDEIVTVSGLPRSGTSLMMKILQSAGLNLLVDNLRTPDQNNPNGYYEFEAVKNLKSGDHTWLKQAEGRVVKIVSPLLQYLPQTYRYKVIFMQRDLGEVLASQSKMLAGMQKTSTAEQDRALKTAYQDHLTRVNAWIMRQPNMRLLTISYNRLVTAPDDTLNELAGFLERKLEVGQMRTAIDPRLYRNRQAVAQFTETRQ